jgi:hypothetical protein
VTKFADGCRACGEHMLGRGVPRVPLQWLRRWWDRSASRLSA